MTTVYLSLGSNIGNSRQYIEKAVNLLGTVLGDIKQAPFYLSKAVGYTDQADFLNTAVSGRTGLSPRELLVFIKTVEQKTGRVQRFHWGPREIDIDIIFYGDQVLETEELVLPHPEFRTREFVLRPLHDLDPELADPVTNRTVAQLLEELAPGDKSILKQVD